jgi:hypothetical protein
MEINEYPFTPQSKILSRFLEGLDLKIYDLEEEVKHQKGEAEKWRKDYMALQAQQLKDGQKMIANTLMAMISPTVFNTDPAGATILAHIRDNLHTIEDVKSYIEEIFTRSKAEMKEQKVVEE